ncbi:hypothetical protein [Clostridium beijerinckii]|jgi:Uncharacterized protein conserved in bacteria|uniref:MORN repeat protein n=1 Tax=Clostridium beijerinckii TaxID=1520 RepID=A0AAW3WF25_CLOBE|nr:hypothetical protein [Clostridium beijerinckii]MBC2459870.1 hypothetical protein [Clostridium beijerinckii]MBC2477373.1 hypothetical protein [Clostridium beijerinckii]MCI1581597.1 hypothetical protein [Clostridium beijerinckii]MCI1585994.1 hypothetical protein [Clostridium beijerinckii]MCI1625167.1 hypothetical protein [Clostridium beijerinckii]
MKSGVFSKRNYSSIIISGILLVLGSGLLISCDSNKEKTIDYSNGDKYVGQIKSEKKDGVGTYTYANGDVYVGEFKNNKREGKGTLTYSNGCKYTGEFANDEMEGKGIYSNPNGDRYEGSYTRMD